MLRAPLILLAVSALIAVPAFADTASKDGTPIDPNPASIPSSPSEVRADFEYNTGGIIDFVPDTGGSASGWGEWFVTSVMNNTGQDLHLVEFGFPCCGPTTGPYGWVVWHNVGGPLPPSGPPESADRYGPFTPLDPGPGTFPPTVYTYIDVCAEDIVIEPGEWFCFGYDNTDTGGQTSFNGVDTWAWYTGMWDPDQSWGRTAILQVKANYAPSPAAQTTWGSIKDTYR